MLYIPKISYYLKVLTEDEVKDFVIYFDEYFQSSREQLCSKLYEEQNMRKVAEFVEILILE